MDAKQLLLSLVTDENLVKEHSRWGAYIAVPFNEIKMVGLIQKGSDLELSLYFGASQAQSRAFYNSSPEIRQLLNSKWNLFGDFHLSNSLQNLFWFDSDMSPEEYISFWKRNRDLLYQHNRTNVIKFLKFLNEKGVVIFDEPTNGQFTEKILSKKYSRFNVCAGLGVIYKLTKDDLTKLNNKDTLSSLLIEKINEGLKVIGKNGNQFLIDPPSL